jgi:hypothetical protein
MLRRRSAWVGLGVVLLAALGAVAARSAGAPRASAQDTAAAGASSRPHPLSCKPSPPVVVSVLATDAPGRSRVRVEALAAVEALEVAVGGTGFAAELPRTVIWRGALAQGESREFEVDRPAPAGASDLWVEAVAAAGPGEVQRSRASLAREAERQVARRADDAGAGRVVVDPATGQKVVEFVGAWGSSR